VPVEQGREDDGVAEARHGKRLADSLKDSEHHCLEEGDLALLSRMTETARSCDQHYVRELMSTRD